MFQQITRIEISRCLTYQYRKPGPTADFKPYGQQVIDKRQEFAALQPGWAVVPKNYEGVRVSCQSGDENGWFLLRLSLHDPVLPLNIESNVSGGVSSIQQKLLKFFQQFDQLDLKALE
jgi:phosphomannomutase